MSLFSIRKVTPNSVTKTDKPRRLSPAIALSGAILANAHPATAYDHACGNPVELRAMIDVYKTDIIRLSDNRNGVCVDRENPPQVCLDASQALREDFKDAELQEEYERVEANRGKFSEATVDELDPQRKILDLLTGRYKRLKQADMGLMAGVPVKDKGCEK